MKILKCLNYKQGRENTRKRDKVQEKEKRKKKEDLLGIELGITVPQHLAISRMCMKGSALLGLLSRLTTITMVVVASGSLETVSWVSSG